MGKQGHGNIDAKCLEDEHTFKLFSPAQQVFWFGRRGTGRLKKELLSFPSPSRFRIAPPPPRNTPVIKSTDDFPKMVTKVTKVRVHSL